MTVIYIKSIDFKSDSPICLTYICQETVTGVIMFKKMPHFTEWTLYPPHNTLSKEFGSRTGRWQDTMSFTSGVIFYAVGGCMVKVERQFCVSVQTSWPKTLSGFSMLYWSLNTSFQNRKYLDVKEQTAGLLYLFTQLKWWQK